MTLAMNQTPSTTRTVLGIDPGTLRVGYALVQQSGWNTAFRYLECGIIRANARDDVTTRIGVVAGELEDIIDEFLPDTLAIEKAFYGRNAASALKLGQARGAIMLLARQRGMSVHEYAPAQVKQTVVGHGRATKEQVQRQVQRLCDLRRLPSTDAADAIAIALCHVQRSPGGLR